MTPQQATAPAFIHSRWFDAVWFSLGWIPVLVAFVVAKESVEDLGARSILNTDAGKAILLFILVVNFVHRHITFPLVYGDAEVFQARSRRYIGLPIAFAVVTLIAASVHIAPVIKGAAPALQKGKTPVASSLSLYLSADRPSPGEKVKRRNVSIEAGATLDEVAKTLNDAAAPRGQAPRGLSVRIEAHPQRHLVFEGAGGWNLGAEKSWFAVRASRTVQKTLGIGPVSTSRHSTTTPLMALLVALSVLWTIYHTLMQKMGILRIYSKVAQAGTAGLDRAFVFVWFAAMVAHLAARDDVRQMASRVSSVGRMVRPFFDVVAPALFFVQFAVAAAAVVVTVLWVRQERKSGSLHWPRALFAASLLALYAAFTYDLVIGFATLAFSHSIEYIAFVSVFSARKYKKRSEAELSWTGRRARTPLRSVVLFALLTTTVFVIARAVSRDWLDIYIVGSSFLHFLYDGWLWKVRKPEVNRHLS